MSLRNARVSLEYLYANVTNETAEMRKLSRMPKTTFHRKWTKITQYRTTERKPGSGRPQAQSPDDKRSICQTASQNPLSLSAKITREFQEAKDVQVSMPTVYQTSKKAGISAKKARKIILLTDAQKQSRFSFCQTWLVDNFFVSVCHDPLPVGTSLAVEEYRNSREEKDTAELHNIE